MNITKKISHAMKIILKSIGIICLALLALLLLAQVSFMVECLFVDEMEYTINIDQTTCTVIGAKKPYGNVLKIPEEIEGYTVTKIAPGAFQEQEMHIIVLPDTIEEIGQRAFYNCPYLSRVYGIENCFRLTSIGDFAFEYCDGIRRMNLPDNILFIGEYAFYGCRIWKEPTIPANVKTIGNGAYAGCFLKEARISESVMTIGDMAFLGCEHLMNFIVNEENPYYTSVDGVLYSKDMKTLYCYPIGRQDEVFTIPEGVENIYYKAFALSLDLKEINLPSTIKTIGEQVFVASKRLKLKIETINYNGTVEMWKAIQKPQNWGDYSSNFVIVCTDGEISKDGTVTYK